MKKRILLLIMIYFVVTICLGLTGCDSSNKPREHTHIFASGWESDETHHWHAASCEHSEEKGEYGEHDWNNGVCSTCQAIRLTVTQDESKESTDAEYTNNY